MDIPTVHPDALKPGDTIGIIAPAGTIENREQLLNGIAAVERMGFHVHYDDRIFQSLRYLAGDDDARAAELQRYFEDPGIQAIIALRGGYGSSRLIPRLDERRLRHNCKLFMGFSDITTLHLYFRRRLGWVTLHGPMAASSSLGNMGVEEEAHLRSTLSDPEYLPRLRFPELERWSPGVGEGILTGGCLSLLVSSLGTAYEIKTEGKILFLEDFGEEPYRLDRMLTHLKLAGKLDRIAGILLGSFENCDSEKKNCSAEEVLKEVLEGLEVPVVANFPAGHGPNNWPIALGVKVRLDADALMLEFLEPAVRAN